MRPTLLFHLYRAATRLLVPFAFRSVSRKLDAHGVAADRIRERLGYATLPRPDARMVWFHAASVGESLSVLTLITRMAEALPDCEFLITSGTPTSADMIAARLPPRTRHQFAPLDAPGPVGRFLTHWRPSAGIFVESEIWPVMLTEARSHGARLALLNARLSEKSVEGWRKRPKTAGFLLDQFAVLFAQSRKTADDLVSMGADPDRVEVGGNLKANASAPPVNAAALDAMREAIGGRPVWIASSTHPGEEEIALEAHKVLLEKIPDLLMILVPRHPDRGDEVEALIGNAGLSFARRSRQQHLAPDTRVYLADTMGETGTWYALSPVVFLGATLVPKGGHNPFEPAMAGCAVMAGPHRVNAADAYAGLQSAGGLADVSDAPSLANKAYKWLTDSQSLKTTAEAAKAHADAQGAPIDRLVDLLRTRLDL